MAQEPNKKPQLWQVYQQHDFIDAKDNQADWRVGYIVEKNNVSKLYKIRFDGWQAKYDQVYRFNSHKLQEFRSIVIGYTGQIQNPALRPGWKFTMAEHQQKLAKLKSFIKQPINHTAHQINQFFRGHNYLYSDFLMTITYNNPQHLASVFQYYKVNIAFACQYLKEVDPEFTLIYKARDNQSFNHLNYSQTAYRNSYFEILDTLYTIIGGYRRLTAFFKQNAQQLKTVLNKSQQSINIKRNYQMHMAIQFYNQRGFEILSELISNKLTKAKNLTPFLFLKSLAQLYLGLSIGMKKTDRQEITRKLIILIQLNLNKLTDKQLKQLHKSNVVSLLDLICQLHQGSQNEEKIKDWALIKQLDVCLLMIKCPYFDKKLKGINGIIQLINRQQINQRQCATIKKWIESIKLFEVLFVDCDNAQLIKKAAQLTKHLDIENILEKQYIYLIWKSRIGKHQAALQQIYNLISTIPLRSKYDTIKHELFEQIAKIPQNQWDDDYIKFIKDYSMNSISWNVTKIKNTFGFKILYQNLMYKKNQSAFQSLLQLAGKMQKTDFIVDFMTDCFKKIAQNVESDMHVDILVQLLKQQNLQVDKSQVSMKEIIINDILRRQPRVEKQIKSRFEIFSEILKSSDAELTFQDFKLLWERFQNQQTRKSFYEWICQKGQGGKIYINKYISPQYRSRLLLELWPLGQDDKFRRLSEEQTIILIELFKSANVLQKNIVKVSNSFRVQNMNLVGFKQIEKAFNEVEDLKVAERLANFISEIYMNPGVNLLKNRQQNINNLLDNITSRIRSCLKLKQYWSIKKQLLLTLKVINQDEQIFPINYTPKFSAFKQFTIYHREREEQKIIKFNIANLFYDFKRTIAEKFKIPIKNCKIYHKNELVKTQQLFKPMIEGHFGTNFEIYEIVAQESLVKRGLIERLDNFFLLLGQTQVEKAAWKIVSQLPLSLKIVKVIQESKSPWNQLTNESIYLELYMLKVANIMNDKWWNNFLATNGLAYLKDKLKKVRAKTDIQKQYLLILTSLIDRGLSKRQPDTKIPEDLFLQCLAILHLMIKQISMKQQKIIFAESSITRNIFSIGEAVSQINLPINILIKEYKQHLDFLKLGLIVTKESWFRKEFLIQLKKITEFDEEISQQVLAILLQQLFQFAISYEQQSRLVEYFEYASFLLQKIDKNILQQYVLKRNQGLVQKIITLIKTQKIEKNIEDTNFLLIGYLKILKHLILFSPLEEQKDISIFLIQKCLFSDLQAKCKTKQSKLASLDVLEKVFHQEQILERDLPFLWELHKNGQWRSRKAEDWVISPNDKMKSSTGYVGIRNLGCICYMISFIQQIFMIPDFRQGILECQDPLIGIQHKQNVLYQMKKMMFNLSYSDKKFFIPRDFCHAFKDIEGNPVNITEQMDIDQFSGILFDRLETQIKGTKHQNIMKDLFGGVFSNEIICKGCPHFSESQQSFLSVALQVKNKKDIYQSLDTMIKGDTLDGDNAYFCQRCSKKVSAVKRLCFKKLPDYLILALKRFQFDFETMTKLKVNDYCQFPHELNIKNYSQQYLRQQENLKAFDDEDCQPDSYFEYQLKGVVIHLGYADSGHYYSFIQQRKQNGKWFQFNDTIVRSFDPKRLPEQAYGGQVGQFEIKQKIKNAYLLIYDRKQKFKKPQLTYQNPYERRQYAQIRKNVLQENKLQKIESILFSEEYYKFLVNLFNGIEKQSIRNYQKLIKFLILAYLTIVIRGKDETPAFSFLKKLHPVVIKDPSTIQWLMLTFAETKILEEFIKHNPAKDIKKLIANWLNSLWPYTKPEVQSVFFQAILQIITVNMENYTQLCQILDSAVKRENICDFLVKKGIVGRLLQNLLRKQHRKFSSIDEIPGAKEKNQIGYQIVPQKVSADKKLKTDLDNGFVFKILTQIIRTCRKKKLAYQNYFTAEELELLIIPTNRIYKILQECKNKFQIRSFVQYLCDLSYKNESLVDQLLNQIYNGIKSFQSKRYRQFFILYKHLSKVQDEFLPKRLAGFSKLVKGLKQNEKYSLDSDIIQQWIIKILKKNKPLQAYLAKQKQMIQYLIVLSTKKTPSEEIIRKNMNYVDAMVSKLHGIRFYRSKRGYLDNAKQKQAILSNISKNVEIAFDDWDSDDDLTTSEVKAGDTIYYFDQKQHLDFLESKVQQVFMDRLTIAPKKSKITQVWKDDQKLTLGYDLEDDDILSQQHSDKTTETEMDPDELEQLSDI